MRSMNAVIDVKSWRDPRHVALLRPRRDDDQRNPEAVAVIPAGPVTGIEDRLDVVRLDRARRRDVVVIAAVLVVGDEQRRVLPRGRVQDGVRDLSDEPLADLDVLRVLLRRRVVVRVDEGERGQRAGGGVGQELVELVLAGAATWRRQDTRDDQPARNLLVVDPVVDLVRVEPVEDRAVRRGQMERCGDVRRNESGGRAGEEEPAVRVRLAQRRAEEPLTDREVLDERIGERQVALVPEAHRDWAARPDEAIVAPAVVRLVAGVPGLSRDVRELTWRAGVLRKDLLAVRIPVEIEELAAVTAQPIHPGPTLHLVGDHPEQVVERVVLHHQHDDVTDLRHRDMSRRQMGKRAAVRAPQPGHGVRDGSRPGG